MSLVDSTVCTVQRPLLHTEAHHYLHHLTPALSSQERAKKGIAKFIERVKKILKPSFISRLGELDIGGVKKRKAKKQVATAQISH